MCFMLFSAGCTSYHDGAVYFHGSGEVLDIRLERYNGRKEHYVRAYGDGGLMCSGSAHIVRGGVRGVQCRGSEGRLLLACNDGRHLKGVWSAETCTSGQGLGVDQYGNTFVLAYDRNRNMALRKTGAGPEKKRPGFSPVSAASPMYVATLGYDDMPVFAAAGAAGYSPRAAQNDSGYFAGSGGRILSTASALKGMTVVNVYLPDEKREVPARIVSVSHTDNIAVLEVDVHRAAGVAVKIRPVKNTAPDEIRSVRKAR